MSQSHNVYIGVLSVVNLLCQANDYNGVKKDSIKYPAIINRIFAGTFVQQATHDNTMELFDGDTTPYLEACAKGANHTYIN